ncbi:MAG: class I SAM-dependent methyltransferase [bacterium]|nr:class I SAM-dependent methyltransferase [bacterium]
MREDKACNSERFSFGENWKRFLGVLNDKRIAEAEISIKEMLGVNDLRQKSFLDIGSGSGLFSLAAKRLGASVHSFDYDAESVACTNELKRRYFPDDTDWRIEQGSALDTDYLKSLGKFDIVYSWGVLHHTGAMWKALENVQSLVASGGKLFISIYNDQGLASKIWWMVKRTYNLLPNGLRFFILLPAFICLWGCTMAKDMLCAKPFATRKNYKSIRGMSAWHDLVDWIGGYPFEVAKPEEVIYFYQKKGFVLVKSKVVGKRLGCNEFLFEKP